MKFKIMLLITIFLFGVQVKSCDNYAIAILAWGSLVNAPRDLAYEKPFEKIKITFPIELSCLSFIGKKNQKITRIIDKNWGHLLSLWVARSTNASLSKAIENLAHREFTTINNIFYIRAICSDEKLGDDEAFIMNNDQPIMFSTNQRWCISKQALKQLPKIKVIELAKWAAEQKYNAAIWTGLKEVEGFDRNKLIQILQADSQTLKKTKEYILNSPDLTELTQFEKNILNDDL